MKVIIFRQREFSPKFSKTREQLREIARANGVKRGRNIMDTIRNLKKAGIAWE